MCSQNNNIDGPGSEAVQAPPAQRAARSGASAGGTASLYLAVALCTAVAGLAAPAQSQAAEPQSFGVYVEGGRVVDSSVHTNMAAIGVRSPVTHTFWDGRVSLRWDAYLSEWRTDAALGQRRHFTQVGLVPMFRYRFDRGASPWFVEGGVGLSYLSASYSNRVKEFSTQWNFSDHLGVGRNFGNDRAHELGLYVKHVSNAGIKSPNPGETFVQLRYGYTF